MSVKLYYNLLFYNVIIISNFREFKHLYLNLEFLALSTKSEVIIYV